MLNNSSKPFQPFLFDDLNQRKVVVDFSGGHVSSDGGLLLLGQLDRSLGISRKLSGCFLDARDQRWVEHSVMELVAQRILGLAAGYEDLNDHNSLRLDPLMALCAGKKDPLGNDRFHEQDRGKALAGASTLNRLELGNDKQTRCHKITADHEAIESLLLDCGVQTLHKNTKEVVIDLDSTDDLIHGNQEGRFYHKYYDGYCYLPLYAFMGSVPLWAQLREADVDGCKGSVPALRKIVAAIRKRCPKARIIVRADSGFCREEIMVWCESQTQVYYCLGLARNERLLKHLEDAFFWTQIKATQIGGMARSFVDFEYRTLDSWSRSRRVIGKAEVLKDKRNPRFIVTNLPEGGFSSKQSDRFSTANCYEQFYCARGDMENKIKEQQLDLFADRTSTHFMKSNQLRLWFSSFAQLMMERLRTIGLKGTSLAKATAGTIRVRLLKIGALFTVSVRRVHIQLASTFPLKGVFEAAHRTLKDWQAEST